MKYYYAMLTDCNKYLSNSFAEGEKIVIAENNKWGFIPIQEEPSIDMVTKITETKNSILVSREYEWLKILSRKKIRNGPSFLLTDSNILLRNDFTWITIDLEELNNKTIDKLDFYRTKFGLEKFDDKILKSFFYWFWVKIVALGSKCCFLKENMIKTEKVIKGRETEVYMYDNSHYTDWMKNKYYFNY